MEGVKRSWGRACGWLDAQVQPLELGSSQFVTSTVSRVGENGAGPPAAA